MASANQHHHRSTTKVAHKPFKTRFASKSALKDRSKGKIERLENGARKTPHQQVMSKLDRRNHAKQRRMNNRQDHSKVLSVFAGKDGAPRNVAVIPLCQSLSSAAAVNSLNSSLEILDQLATEGLALTHVDRFNQKINYVAINRDFNAALAASQAADYVLFLLSESDEVDELGELIIRGIEGQGVSQVLTAVMGLERIESPKRKSQVLASLKSFINHFFPDQEKVFSLDSHQECQNLVRSICTSTPKGIRWREDRSWMLVEDVQWSEDNSYVAPAGGSQAATGIFTGYVRGQGLKADRLVQIGDWGEFQVEKIMAMPSIQSKKGKTNAITVDQDNRSYILDTPTEDQDDLNELAPEEVAMDDADVEAMSVATSDRRGVLLDDHRYFDGEENENVAHLPTRLPKGTSKYQAAWYLGEISDSGSDMEDVDGDIDMNVDEPFDIPGRATSRTVEDQTDVGPSVYAESEMDLDLSPDQEADQLAAYRARRKADERDQLEFPDEIELHPNVLARERLIRYRGLKSIKTSVWDTEEDKIHEPEDWGRLLDIHDYKAARSKVVREALVGGVRPGTRVQIHVRKIPLSVLEKRDPNTPLTIFSLLRHEHKRTTVNFTITLNSDYPNSIRSKEELVMQCGPRRFIINPIFSQLGSNPNNVYKFERYLQPGRTAVASFIAPVTWGAVPVLFFKRVTRDLQSDQPEEQSGQIKPTTLDLIGHGTALPAGTSRITVKRVILTGAPYKINRRLVTVRYMFFNTEDVLWFQALQLWTNRGRLGTIKDTLGTHGYFKAMFDGKIGMQDAVAVSLYKRVWPRPARPFRALE